MREKKEEQLAKIPYANTEIAPERTKAEIEKLLKQNGVEDIQWTTIKGETTLKFFWEITMKGEKKRILFEFKPPYIPAKRRTWQNNHYEMITVNLESQSFRLLWHYLKNKLDAVRWGLVSMEKEFLSQALVSLPNGTTTTIGEQITQVYDLVRQPALEQRDSKGERVIEGEIIDSSEESRQ
jgi:hypothetical protein